MAKYILSCLIFLLLLVPSITNASDDHDDERIKIALRELGNQLLLAHCDSTSRILPIVEIEPSKFEISFEKSLSIDQGILVDQTKSVLQNLDLGGYYRAELIQCKDGEVAYSYEIAENPRDQIIPCSGRPIPEACYTIQIRFLKTIQTNNTEMDWPIYLSITISSIGLVFWLIYWLYFKQKKGNESLTVYKIGSLRFYPDQFILTSQNQNIKLSPKECKLLSILIASPNRIIKREELTKPIWEDEGVIVGRSLDTYISKLRKKLSPEPNVKISNIHGIGYKMEITE